MALAYRFFLFLFVYYAVSVSGYAPFMVGTLMTWKFFGSNYFVREALPKNCLEGLGNIT